MRSRWVFVSLLTLGLWSGAAEADCPLTVRLYGCVQDAITYKPLTEARVVYLETGKSVYTDERGCFLIDDVDTVSEGDFFPNYFCVFIYKAGYEFTVACQQRPKGLEPFPPCVGSAPLYLSFQFGVILASELSTGISETEGGTLPRGFELYQNYPNPFNPATVVEYVLAEAAEVRLDVYDIRGAHVARLQEGRLGAGLHSVRWDASDRPAGVYFYRLRVNGEAQTRKMVLLK